MDYCKYCNIELRTKRETEHKTCNYCINKLTSAKKLFQTFCKLKRQNSQEKDFHYKYKDFEWTLSK